MVEQIIEREENLANDAEALLDEVREYYKEKNIKPMRRYSHFYAGYPVNSITPEANKEGSFRTINYIASMEDALRRQSDLLRQNKNYTSQLEDEIITLKEKIAQLESQLYMKSGEEQ